MHYFCNESNCYANARGSASDGRRRRLEDAVLGAKGELRGRWSAVKGESKMGKGVRDGTDGRGVSGSGMERG